MAWKGAGLARADRCQLSVAVIACALMSACGSSSPGTPPAPQPSPPAATLTAVSVSGSAAFGAPGQSSQLSATARWSDGSTTGVTSSSSWRSANAAVATVSPTGLVTSVGYGTTDITATYQALSGTLSAVVRAPTLESSVCGSGPNAVAIVVDPAMVGDIRAALTVFERDLCAERYTVIETSAPFASPPELRAYLSGLYDKSSGQLEGAILIGRIPYAYQLVTMTYSNPSIPPASEEAISFQYYNDLDGAFAASPAYVSPGGHPYSYDTHTGNVDWEIWVGVMPLYKGDYSGSVRALNSYFAKNHAYRTAPPAGARVFLEITELLSASSASEHASLMGALKTGQYSWTPFSNDPTSLIYFDSPSAGLTVAQGYARLSAGVADFTVVDSHGNWYSGGQINIPWVESHPIDTTFFWSSGCSVANLDYRDNFLSSVLYSPTSAVLVAKGTTNDSGGMGNNADGFYGHNVATALSNGSSFGRALLAHVNVPLLSPWSASREFHFGTPVVLGDPTLRRSTNR
jgi:hypothetical protein